MTKPIWLMEPAIEEVVDTEGIKAVVLVEGEGEVGLIPVGEMELVGEEGTVRICGDAFWFQFQITGTTWLVDGNGDVTEEGLVMLEGVNEL